MHISHIVILSKVKSLTHLAKTKSNLTLKTKIKYIRFWQNG